MGNRRMECRPNPDANHTSTHGIGVCPAYSLPRSVGSRQKTFNSDQGVDDGGRQAQQAPDPEQRPRPEFAPLLAPTRFAQSKDDADREHREPGGDGKQQAVEEAEGHDPVPASSEIVSLR